LTQDNNKKLKLERFKRGGGGESEVPFFKMSAAFSHAAAIFQDGRFFFFLSPPQDAPLL